MTNPSASFITAGTCVSMLMDWFTLYFRNSRPNISEKFCDSIQELRSPLLSSSLRRGAASIDWLGLLNHLNHQTPVAHPSLLVCAPARTLQLEWPCSQKRRNRFVILPTFGRRHLSGSRDERSPDELTPGSGSLHRQLPIRTWVGPQDLC